MSTPWVYSPASFAHQIIFEFLLPKLLPAPTAPIAPDCSQMLPTAPKCSQVLLPFHEIIGVFYHKIKLQANLWKFVEKFLDACIFNKCYSFFRLAMDGRLE